MNKLVLPQCNSVTLIGRLTRDPELKYTSGGHPICRFSIAVNRYFKDAKGEFREETCFVPIVVWRNMALRCGERLKKGMPVFVIGRLKSREWESKEGKKQSILEVESSSIQILEKTEKTSTEELVVKEEEGPSE